MKKKTVKRIITLIVLLAISGGLLSAYFLLGNKPDDTAENETVAQTQKLLDIDSTIITKLSYSCEQGTQTLTKDEQGVWTFDTEPDLPVKQSDIQGIAAAFGAMTVKTVIEESPADYSAYGLDKPEYTVTAYADGMEVTVYFGTQSMSDASGRYVYTSQDGRVVTASGAIIDRLVFDPYTIAEYEKLPTLDKTVLQKMKYEDSEQSIELINNPADLTLADAIGTSQWYYRIYGRYMACNYDNIITFLDTVCSASFTGLAAYNTDLKTEYGIDESSPRLSVVYNEAGDEFTLLFGDVKDDLVYVSLPDDDNVYTMDSSFAQYFKEKNLNDYLMSYGFALCNFDGIESLEVSCGDKKLTIEVTRRTVAGEDGDEVVCDCLVNGVPTDETETRKLFASLIRITADHILADEETDPDRDVVFNCTYHTNYDDQPQISYTILEFGDVYYQAAVNGNIKYAVTKQEFNVLMENIKKYLI